MLNCKLTCAHWVTQTKSAKTYSSHKYWTKTLGSSSDPFGMILPSGQMPGRENSVTDLAELIWSIPTAEWWSGQTELTCAGPLRRGRCSGWSRGHDSELGCVYKLTAIPLQPQITVVLSTLSLVQAALTTGACQHDKIWSEVLPNAQLLLD